MIQISYFEVTVARINGFANAYSANSDILNSELL